MTKRAEPPAVLHLLAVIVEESFGIHYASGDLDVLAGKARDRAEEAGFESLLDYYYFLRYDPRGKDELDNLCDALAVGETYFFREAAPIEVAIRRYVAPVVAAGRRPRIWCAASATGEEPITVAMLLADRDLLGKVDLIASDISRKFLSRAQAGQFSRRALRDPARPDLVRRWLHTRPDGAITVAPEIRRAIEWRRLNLSRPDEVRSMPPAELILCRNVLIYFSDRTVTKVVSALSEVLAPGGALLVGVSESLLRFGTALTCQEEEGVYFYTKERGE